jgi:serine/threonine protein kinase
MARVNLPKENEFEREQVLGYKLCREIGRGKIGVVYKASHPKTGDIAACKIIPKENLKSRWETEIEKIAKLSGIPTVAQYKKHGAEQIKELPYICIFYEYVGYEDKCAENLRDYVLKNPSQNTLPFIDLLVEKMLETFVAMKAVDVSHNDLHAGNILIFHDPRSIDPETPIIKITDFGIGGSYNKLEPKDDYKQLTLICCNLLEKLKYSNLDGKCKFFYDYYLEEFFPKKVLETHPTEGTFVRNPRELLKIFKDEIPKKYSEHTKTYIPSKPAKLTHPFDYLRCEQMGNSFELLQRLYSEKFPGYSDFLRRNNTILTGPRGCGKTTIFRNMSLKTQILGDKVKKAQDYKEDYIGIYYHCNDLYFAFPYLKEISDETRKTIIHYFNLSILYEILDLFAISKDKQGFELTYDVGTKLQDFIKESLPSYQTPPLGTDILAHLKSIIVKEKQVTRQCFERNGNDRQKPYFTPMDFIRKLCNLIQTDIPWTKNRAIYFFLDDYSLPNISKQIQEALHDFILFPSEGSEYFFKISTESIISFYPYTSKRKLLEEGREYVVVDLGYFFLHEDERAKSFIFEVINNRLENSQQIDMAYQDIEKILGNSHYESYNHLAREIRGKKPGHIHYCGLDIITGLCSGDVAQILDLIKRIFELAGGYEVFTQAGKVRLPISKRTQNKAIRETGNNFLNNLEICPFHGLELRKIAEAFGEVAHHFLITRNSKDQNQYPPWQAFRIEVREPLDLMDDETTLGIYNELLRYSVFIRDVAGKSQLGKVAPKLYLRRLLIPTFLLTPNKRDNIGLSKEEFLKLLTNPEDFTNDMKKKKSRRKQFQPGEKQLYLFPSKKDRKLKNRQK